MAKKFQNFIDGKWVDAASGKTFENRNPARWDEVVGVFPKSGKEDVGDAVRAARAAFDGWRLTPAPKRGDIMRAVGDLMVARKEDLARQMTREMGRCLPRRGGRPGRNRHGVLCGRGGAAPLRKHRPLRASGQV